MEYDEDGELVDEGEREDEREDDSEQYDEELGPACQVLSGEIRSSGEAHDPLSFPPHARSPRAGANPKTLGPTETWEYFLQDYGIRRGWAMEAHFDLNGIPGCESSQSYQQDDVQLTGSGAIVWEERGIGGDQPWNRDHSPDVNYEGGNTSPATIKSLRTAGATFDIYEGKLDTIHWLDSPSVEFPPGAFSGSGQHYTHYEFVSRVENPNTGWGLSCYWGVKIAFDFIDGIPHLADRLDNIRNRIDSSMTSNPQFLNHGCRRTLDL